MLDAISTGKSIVEVLTDFTPAGAIAFVYGMLILPFLLVAAGAPLFFIVFHAIIWGWIFAIAYSYKLYIKRVRHDVKKFKTNK